MSLPDLALPRDLAAISRVYALRYGLASLQTDDPDEMDLRAGAADAALALNVGYVFLSRPAPVSGHAPPRGDVSPPLPGPVDPASGHGRASKRIGVTFASLALCLAATLALAALVVGCA